MKQNITKRDFGTAPSNYIPGFGRGAQGFITRSDIGPAKITEPIQGLRPNRGNNQDDDDGDREDYNDAKYDEWNGYQIPLFNQGDYDDEDREADQVYQIIDEQMEGRRRSRREKIQLAEIKRIRQERPTLALQFSDLKRDLAKITVQEWLNIPEAGDYTVKKRKIEKYVPVPDSILDTARRQNLKETIIQEEQQQEQKLNEIGEARGTILSLKLDRMGDSVTGQSIVDKKGYLTSLASLPISSGTEIGDYKKARLLLKSLIQSDSHNSFGWIAAARVEELDGKAQTARNILAQGLQQCENNEDIWIECARLESDTQEARQILAKAASTHPQSVKIWLAAANRETDRNIKIKVLKRALEFIPNSERLWKEIIELSVESEARVLLYKAVECIPSQLEFWLALAKLEKYEDAKIVLNKARQFLPTEHSIWIHAAKLEESSGKERSVIVNVLSKGIKVLAKNGVKIVRDDWLAEAELAEKSENYQTCYAIVEASAEYGVHEDEREKVWLEDIAQLEKKNSIFTARALLNYATKALTDKISFYDRLIEFEQKHSSKWIPPQQLDSPLVSIKEHWYLDEALENAIKNLPNLDKYWTQAIIRRYQLKQYEIVDELFLKSEQYLLNNENLLCLSGKLQTKLGNYQKGKQIFQRALQVCGGSKTWSSFLKCLLVFEQFDEANVKGEEACQKYPKCEKVWNMWARTKELLGLKEETRKVYDKAIQNNPQALSIWKNYILFEISQGLYSRVRPLLERARSRIPKNPDLWALSVQLELEANNHKGAVFTLNKALQECPRHGQLWSLSIELEPKNTRKKRSADAVTQCVDDPYVYLSTAKIFYKENKMEKFKRWVEKAILLNPRLGDAWAYLYLDLKEEQGFSEQLFETNLIESRPKYGILWQQYRRNELGWKLSTLDVLKRVATRILQELQRLD